MNENHVCMEEDCHETEYLIECNLTIYKGDVPLWYVVRFQGLRAAWNFIRHGWYEETYYYCVTHCQKNGFCYGCGQFWAGCESFDFAPTGLCSNCKDDPDLTGDYGDDEDYYEPPEDYYDYAQEYEAEPDNKRGKQ